MLALAILSLESHEGQAAEDATGWYALGSKTSKAGFVPPPGTYFTNVNYYYQGDAKNKAAIAMALRGIGSQNASGTLLVDADFKAEGQVYYNLPSVLWVAPGQVLGGNVGFGAIVPVGWKEVSFDIDALANLTLGPPINQTLQFGGHFSGGDSATKFGDPVLNGVIGWHQGNWHWNVNMLVNVPIGPWDSTSISNLSFHHWVLDTTVGLTWLDPKTGLEISVAPGLTLNWENPDTGYTTGTEFHVEFAMLKHFSNAFAAGIAGFHYQQITADRGAPDVLGDFRGRTSGVGPIVTYSFTIGTIPVAAQAVWLHEFDTENRPEGDFGVLRASVPLSMGRR